MQVLLKKEGLFGFDETKYTKIPSDVFDTMVSSSFAQNKSKVDEVEAEMFYFKNMRDYDDYNYNHNKEKDIFDKTKDVFVTPKGEIFVFSKSKDSKGKITMPNNSVTISNDDKTVTNVTTTNTEKDITSKT